MANPQYIQRSDNGTGWLTVTSPLDGDANGYGMAVRWADFVDPNGHTQQFFIGIIVTSTLVNFVTSPDGITWTVTLTTAIGTNRTPMIGVVNDGSTVPAGSFGILIFDGSNNVTTGWKGSNDGSTWVNGVASAGGPGPTSPGFGPLAATLTTAQQSFSPAIVFANGTWFVCDGVMQGLGSGSANVNFITNLSGSWSATQAVNNPGNNAPDAFCGYSPSLGRLVAGTSTNSAANSDEIVSTDNLGSSWTSRVRNTLSGTGGVLCGARSESIPMFVAGGFFATMRDSAGSGATLMSSPDAATAWTSRVGNSGTVSDIVWSTAHSLFVAVRTNSIVNSSDGTTWTAFNLAQPSSVTDAFSIAVSPELSRFVVFCKYSIVSTPGVFLGKLVVGSPVVARSPDLWTPEPGLWTPRRRGRLALAG